MKCRTMTIKLIMYAILFLSIVDMSYGEVENYDLSLTAKTDESGSITLTTTGIFDSCVGYIQIYRDQYEEVLCGPKAIHSGGSCVAIIPAGRYWGTHKFYADLSGDCVEQFAKPVTINFNGCNDLDNDGSYGISANCETGNDCDDNDKTIGPGVIELCDGKDNNCNGQIDEGCCDLKITGFQGSNSTLDPVSGGSVRITGAITEGSGKPVTWTMTVAGKTYSDTGTSPSVTWNGRGANGEVVDPGSYTTTLTATTEDGKCSDTQDISFKVTAPPEGQCGFLIVDFGSSAHVANGNLSHSQELFSARGIGPELGMTLHYNSLDPFNGSLGRGWSHDYDITLTQNSDGSVLLKEGNWKRRLYTLSGGAYVPQPDDRSTLTANPDATYTLTHRDGLKYTFNTDGTIASITDRNNNSVTLTYTGGKLTSVTDSGGRNATLSLDGDGRITNVTDPAGNNYALGYSNGILAHVLYPDGGAWQFTYDDKAFMLTKSDPLGATTTYAYDDNRRVISATDSEGKGRTITYPTGGDTVKTTTFTEKDGGVWQYTYDTEKGTLNQKTDPQGGTTSYTYDANGNRLSFTEADGSVTSYTYDAFGSMTSITDALGQTTGYTYNDFGQVTSVTDPAGATTVYAYDDKGNLTRTTDATGATTSYEYDGKGNLTKVITPLGQTTTLAYDTFGNLASITDSAGAKTSYTYDASGNMVTMTDSLGAVTRFEYNAKNRLVKTVDPNGNITTYGYDLAGNRISETDANGNTTTYEYNAKGQVIKTKDALGNVTVFAYGGSGCASCGGGTDKLTALTDANGAFTAYQYDTLGRLLKEIDPLDNETGYTYDLKGNPVTRTDANGATITYSYDGNGRLLKKSYPDGTEETFSYDVKGNILTAANRNISYTFSYDPAGRMLSSADSNGRTVSYVYDTAGRKTKLTYPDGFSANYAYDATGRLSRLTTADGQAYVFSYDSLGRRTRLNYPNGTSATYGYDSTGKLLTLTHKGALGTTIDSFIYTHDKVGNRLTKKQPLFTTAYTYDAVYRLTRAKPSLPLESTEQYGYDAVGNRLSGPKAQQTYQYNQGNQLTEETARPANFLTELFGPNAAPTGKARYDYDKNGNLIKKTETTILPDKPLTTLYIYDFENRLTRVEIRFGPAVVTTTFSYDPLGRRIGKKTTGTAGPLNGTDTRTYLYDGPNILLEYRDTDILGADFTGTTRYLHGPGIDEPLSLTRNGATWYYHSDGLGSIVALSNNHGIVAEKYGYDSFGNRKPGIHLINQPYAFTGREWDAETGLYYYRARYYDPAAGRFISKDPIGFRGGINLYAYTDNNSINLVDPGGESAQVCVRRFAFGPIAYAFAPRHCYVMFNNNYNDTLSYDGKVGDDASPKTWFNACYIIRPEKGCEKECSDARIRAAMMKCVNRSYNFFSHNCCDCVRGALIESKCKMPIGLTIANYGF